jgi:hypothetical protein
VNEGQEKVEESSFCVVEVEREPEPSVAMGAPAEFVTESVKVIEPGAVEEA